MVFRTCTSIGRSQFIVGLLVLGFGHRNSRTSSVAHVEHTYTLIVVAAYENGGDTEPVKD